MTVAVVLVVAAALTPVGAVGPPSTAIGFEAVEGSLEPAAFNATTVKVTSVPADRLSAGWQAVDDTEHATPPGVAVTW